MSAGGMPPRGRVTEYNNACADVKAMERVRRALAADDFGIEPERLASTFLALTLAIGKATDRRDRLAEDIHRERRVQITDSSGRRHW